MTTLRSALARIAAQEDLNFLLTNRIPRRLATRFIGWFSRIENPLVRDVSIGIWRLFSDLDLSEAKTTRFRSMHDCFIRELKDGARPIAADPSVLVSPCDAIVGANGRIEGTRVFQVKGFPYSLADLVPDAATVAQFRDGSYVTLRLTAGMYHRFHAPHDCRVESVTYIAGDTWNVNPIALKRIEALFCKNERAVVRTRLAATGHAVALVPVAAILVASLRFRFLDIGLDLRLKGPCTLPCDAALAKGQEMGWFQHGSTIIVLAPKGFSLCDTVREGHRIRLGEPLMRLPDL
ncbi:archaetidylserine decarboxylase [Methylobacterium nodulans]|uniref:phosphatidylserine decarboxylase n=1 Tax=Methylobacterium nodulans (strain LMG 21967 / CNCM I-2342 / ORS 2060) TaxID=460265 RepID=B8IFV8_METNO|nr:archaetidylserine decarboxylase [Methylobacterium nodulans]ACL59668.1 phosphatidylserine decarboxylase [Methylobacterium nodulans ORS 2060]